MDNKQSKLNTLFLGIFAISFAIIAYKQLFPSYVPVGQGTLVVDPKSGLTYKTYNGKLEIAY
ncbi:MAG: hypothetical protein EOO46_17855 [Flavobacterium sp.]|nr:MAG: hypothetical protein EOO46_17855 [Flavobacterium sp.]